MKNSLTARIARLEADIRDILAVWDDSDEQELAFFRAELPEMRAELSALREQEQEAKGHKSWKRSAKRIRKEAHDLVMTSALDYDAINAEKRRLQAAVEQAESRVLRNYDVSVSGEANALLAEVREAAEKAHFNRRDRLEYLASVGSNGGRSLSIAERQYRDELRLAGILP